MRPQNYLGHIKAGGNRVHPGPVRFMWSFRHPVEAKRRRRHNWCFLWHYVF
jgi:hypothetical protein